MENIPLLECLGGSCSFSNIANNIVPPLTYAENQIKIIFINKIKKKWKKKLTQTNVTCKQNSKMRQTDSKIEQI